ncbi:MAG TPA: LapA family protein [Burkholderiaceae bacterium]|nr:LapA family protein [Burkholderiaceae bacterium]
MRLRTVLLLLLLALFAVFTILNWSAFTAPTTLSLLVGTVEAPLGLLLLGFIVLIAAVFLLLLALQQATVLVETRRTAKELSAQRTLADEAEASRFTALRQHLDESLQRFEAQAVARHAALMQRLDALEDATRVHIEQTGNSLAAGIGEVDDRVERLAGMQALPAPRT